MQVKGENMKRFIASVIAFVASHSAHGNHIAISFGPSLNGGVNPKYASIGYELGWGQLTFLSECGAWFSEKRGYACAEVVSIRVETLTGLFMRIGAGPAWVSQVDDRLSSRFNFSLQSAVGLTHNGWSTGLKYQHYSNAGIVPPNLGRDFILALIEIGI